MRIGAWAISSPFFFVALNSPRGAVLRTKYNQSKIILVCRMKVKHITTISFSTKHNNIPFQLEQLNAMKKAP